jgi:hypothetical protein
MSTAATRQAAGLSEDEIDRLVAAIFDASAVPFEERPWDIPCAIRRECACGRVATDPLMGRGAERIVAWTCPVCGFDDFECADQEPCTRRG